MNNKYMELKLAEGECLDVRKIGRLLAGETDLFVLDTFKYGLDYCDAETERWIWSIGRDESTGKYYASVDSRFYTLKGFECVWLR